MEIWQKLADKSDAELARIDTSTVNLACALHLPGTERIDSRRYRSMLDRQARAVDSETCRLLPRFGRTPEAFGGSEGYFRAMVLTTVLQRDFGIHYDPDLIDRGDFFHEPKNLFLHGVLETGRGTCTSLPPVYLAVGRRLGYPLKLVRGNNHLFVRWDGGSERFNIECTAHGLVSHDDEHYLQWPSPTTAEEAERADLLRSMSPREELATYISARGHCWYEQRQYRPSSACYATAMGLAPKAQGHWRCLHRCIGRWIADIEERKPPGFPHVTLDLPPRTYPHLPDYVEQDIARLDALDWVLRNPDYERDWWGLLRRNPAVRPPGMPQYLHVGRKKASVPPGGSPPRPLDEVVDDVARAIAAPIVHPPAYVYELCPQNSKKGVPHV